MGEPNQDTVNVVGHNASEWKGPDGTHWLIDRTWAEIDGRAEMVRLEIRCVAGPDPDGTWSRLRSAEAPRPIRSTTLRALPMRDFDDDRAAWVEMLSDDGPWGDERPDDRAELSAAFSADGRGRRLVGEDGAPLSAEDALEEVARIYRTALGSPTKRVAEVLHISRSAAAKRVARARAAGLLPPARPAR